MSSTVQGCQQETDKNIYFTEVDVLESLPVFLSLEKKSSSTGVINVSATGVMQNYLKAYRIQKM